MPDVYSINRAQARKIALLSQGLHKQSELGRGKNAALKAIQKLGYIQIDTISVVERAHHHTLWTRANGYQTKHLELLQREGGVFEYWSHAAAYLPIEDFRYSLPKKRAIKNGEKHWYQVEQALLDEVLERVKIDGPLQSKDFEGENLAKPGNWSWKPAKRALEHLFMRGDLMIARREGFQKVFDLTERVVDSTVDTSFPSDDEMLEHLVTRCAATQGLFTAAQAAYLRKGIKPRVKKKCDELLERGLLRLGEFEGESYYLRSDFECVLNQPLSRKKIKILSPFDNLLIQRSRAKKIFNFDYQIECYVPAAKRIYGYFVLPILWGHELVARMDAKVDRLNKCLYVRSLYVETAKRTEFINALELELDQFAAFNCANDWEIQSIQ